MESFELHLPSAAAPAPATPATGAGASQPAACVCGVVASGNLEVLVERHAAPDCIVTVATAAEGFQTTWQAVLVQFAREHAAGGLRFSLNDVGATPAVVALRLAQAREQMLAEGA